MLSLAVAALVAGTTDLRGVVEATAGTRVWSSPALALGGVAFAVVVIAETGRQPVDNPDTHLELTMVHEGPLLSTRDATSPICSGPPPHGIGSCSSSPRRSSSPTLRASGGSSGCYPSPSSCSVRPWRSPRRTPRRCVLLVPRLLSAGAVVALLGIVAWLVETA